MPFELYRNRPGRRDPAEPAVTIQKGGYMTMSEAAYDMLGRPDAVALYYDPANIRIGMQGSQADYAFSVTPHPTGRSKRVQSTRGFISKYGIPVDKARRYPARYDQDQKMLIVDLADGQAVMRGGIAADENNQ